MKRKTKKPIRRRAKVIVMKDAALELFRMNALKNLKTATGFVVVTANDGELKFITAASPSQVEKIWKALRHQAPEPTF